MAKITINSITSSFASNTLLNTNFAALTSELNNKVLYRDNPVGEPNSMNNDLDMNSNDILNVNDVYADNVILNGVAIAASAIALPIATDSIKGVVELSLDAEAQAKTGNTVITASNLAAMNATETMSGLVEKATTAEAIAGTANKYPDAAGVLSEIRGNIVGTVSQSGGIPTGAIIETGSNANGTYTKFADGTMICRNTVSTASIACTTSDPILGFKSPNQVWTYPAAFTTVDSYQATGVTTPAVFTIGISTTSAQYVWYSVSSSAAATRNAGLLVTGRWY